jgi:uncharacterized protein YegJ (DUF2314 family)
MKTCTFALLLPILFCGCGDKKEKNATSTGRVIQVADDDSEMDAAMEAARASFGAAWNEIRNDRERPAPKFAAAMVKARFPDPKDPEQGEHLWIDEITYDGSAIGGVVASEPLDLPEPKLGDRVSFPLDRLSDWLIVEEGVAKGSYTVQLLRKRMSAVERAEHDARYPFRFVEP